MPSKGNFTWHPPFFRVFSQFTPTIIHVYNLYLPDASLYGILEYRKNLYNVRKLFHNRRRRHLVRMSAPFFLMGYGWDTCVKSEEEMYHGRNDHKGERRH